MDKDKQDFNKKHYKHMEFLLKEEILREETSLKTIESIKEHYLGNNPILTNALIDEFGRNIFETLMSYKPYIERYYSIIDPPKIAVFPDVGVTDITILISEDNWLKALWSNKEVFGNLQVIFSNSNLHGNAIIISNRVNYHVNLCFNSNY